MRSVRERIGLYGDGPVVGGAERSLLNLAAAYEGARDLVILSPSDALLDEAAQVVPHLARHRLEPPDGLVTTARGYRHAFRGLDLALLQVTLTNPFLSRGALLAGYLARIPTVAVEQLVLPSRRRQGALLARAWFAPLAGHVAVGTASADDLHAFFGVPRRRLTVVHNGVPARQVAPDRSLTGNVVGCVARLDDQKNLTVLLQAMVAVPDASLVLVGDGPRRGELEALAGSLGIAARVHFLGWLDDPRAVLAGFDVFALPSRDESFPLTIVEAMLSGVPVVATRVGSVGDAIEHGRTGLLVEVDDVDGLAAALRRLLGDADERTQLASAARALATEAYTDTVMAARYDRLWTDVLDRRRRSR